MTKLQTICAGLLTLFSSIFAALPQIIEAPAVLAYVEERLPHQGLLKQTEDGFLYIELPKEYVFEILPLLNRAHIAPPPYFEAAKVGAHITVATAQEMADRGYPMSRYLGQSIPFSIDSLCQVELENSQLGSKLYMLKIESPTIAEIRQHLGLSPKIRGYDFHITVAVE